MDPTVGEWLHLLLRWAHVIAGIMWIGQTYFFNWLENRLGESLDAATAPNVAGNVWMVHGGGFYLVEKQRVPALMPRTLHWFKYESLVTWLTGVALLVLVYYLGGIVIDERVRPLSGAAAAAIGLGLLTLSWVAYDLLWRSPLGRVEPLAAAICYAAVVGIAFGLTRLFSARAAYLHVGAMFGTIMVSNVWMRILPGQRRMIAATRAGTKPDLAEGLRAKGRSKHNTFMSVPLIFIMVSNHFPTATYGSDHGWLVLAGLVLLGGGVAKLLRDH